MTRKYAFRILDKPDRLDNRSAPQPDACLALLVSLFSLNADEAGRAGLGQWIERSLEDRDIVDFHQERRNQGCCPLVKWKCLDG